MGWFSSKEEVFKITDLIKDQLNATGVASGLCLEETVKLLLKFKKEYEDAKLLLGNGNSVESEILAKIGRNSYMGDTKEDWLRNVLLDVDEYEKPSLYSVLRLYKADSSFVNESDLNEIKSEVIERISNEGEALEELQEIYKKKLRAYVKLALESKRRFSELSFLKVPYS